MHRLGDNYPMWMRRTGDDTGPDPVRQLDYSGIGKHLKSLIDAAHLRGMAIF